MILNKNFKFKFAYFTVLFPTIGKILSNLNMIEFFPLKPLKFLGQVTNEIINRRKQKLEVMYFIEFTSENVY